VRKLVLSKEELKSKFGEAILEVSSPKANRVIVKITSDKVVEVAKYLKERGFDMPVSAGATDYIKEKKFEVFWIVWSSSENVVLILKTDINREEPVVDSLVSVWKGVQKFERETWELFGISFKGHPKLKRLLLPEDWDYEKEGYPLRKDFSLKPYTVEK